MQLLFVLAVDALATWLIKACSHGLLKGFHMTSNPEGIPLLQYVDNTTSFIERSVEEVKNLSTLVDLFADISCQISMYKFWAVSRRGTMS